MSKYKLTEGEARLLVAIFEHLKPYYERAKTRHTSVADEMSTKTILETYDELLDRALVVKLTKRERTIIKYRYGLSKGGKCYTHEEIAPKFDVTRERICQIETLALCKIKQYMTELNDEETDVATRLLGAKAREYEGQVVGTKLQDDAVSEDVSMRNWVVCTCARNKLAIQLEIRKFKEQR